MQDGRAAAQADAFTASADDAAAVFYNPACLTLSRGTQVSVGELTLFPDWHFDGRRRQQRVDAFSVVSAARLCFERPGHRPPARR